MTALNKLLSSLPFRLTLAYMGAFVLAAMLIVAFIGWRANELLTTKVIETLAAEVTGLREQFQTGGLAGLRSAVAERSSEPGSSLYLLVDDTGRRIGGNLFAVPPELASGDKGGGLFRYRRVAESGSGAQRLAVGVPLTVPGGYKLIVGRDIEDQRQFADTMWSVALWSIGLLSLLGIGAGLVISRSVLGRIEAVGEAARKIMAGDLSRRIPLSGAGDELDRLAEGLNAMLTRIDELMGALREVSDNIAHDLKTPLTRLRSRAESALRQPDDPGAYREALTRTIEEADELIRTFNSLLLIAKLEAGAVAESMVPVDPAGVIADVAELYEPVAEQAGLQLEVSAHEGACILANRELVGQAIANLVDNAIKYSRDIAHPGAEATALPIVTIAMQRVGDRVEIAVGDRGPGILPADRQRALQRFVRLEASRSQPGSGLGLSLVSAVARLHGGSVRLEDNAPGLKAVLVLPMAQSGTKPLAVAAAS